MNSEVETSNDVQPLPIDISILVVDGDSTCLTIVSKMLRTFGYKVMTAKRATDALCIVREREDELDLVLTEAHLHDIDKYELLETLGEMSNLPVIIMSADDNENAMLGGLFKGAVFYLVKPIIMNDIKNLWQYAYMNKRERMVDTEGTISFQGESSEWNSSDEDSEGQSSVKNTKRKAPEEIDKDEEEDNDYSTTTKRPKLIWTNELHNKFLQAVQLLGVDRAHPKKILQHMNVPGLRKENISSHLQKHRLYLKRKQDFFQRAMNGESTQSSIASYYPSTTFNLQGGILQFPNLQSMMPTCQPEFRSNYQKNLSNPMSMPSFGSGHSFNSLDSTGNDMLNSKYGQFSLSSNQLNSAYPSSSNVGTKIASNRELASSHQMGNYISEDFLNRKMDLSNVENSGFEITTHFSTSSNTVIQPSPPLPPPPLLEQQQVQFLLPQQSPLPPALPQQQEEHNIFEAERGEIDQLFDMEKGFTQLFHGEDFNGIWSIDE